MLIGLGFRAGASPVLDLPPPFYHVMTSTSLVEPSLLREDFLVASANAIRAGICSVYPEVRFKNIFV